VSQSAEDLIRALLTESENRLDYNGIRAHLFFADVDFDNIRQSIVYSSLCDTYFCICDMVKVFVVDARFNDHLVHVMPQPQGWGALSDDAHLTSDLSVCDVHRA